MTSPLSTTSTTPFWSSDHGESVPSVKSSKKAVVTSGAIHSTLTDLSVIPPVLKTTGAGGITSGLLITALTESTRELSSSDITSKTNSCEPAKSDGGVTLKVKKGDSPGL